ncbi:hypothetical protein CRUP_030953, partial [Coryphaenoides rupestris]
TKTGIYLLQEGNEEPFNIRLHLARDILTIQEQDVLCERTVTIRRQAIGGFGLSIKGGAEHKIPVVISKISKEQKAELSGLLFIGDGILQINGINVRSYRHEEAIVYMGWADEKELDSVHDRMYTPKFLALRGSSLFKFSAPPVTTWDWTRAEKSFTVYEIMCKVLKDNDLLDKRKHCFSVQTEAGEDLFYSVELDYELLTWEKAFQMATFLESSGTSSPLCDSGLHLNYHPNNTKRWVDLRLIPLLHSRLSHHVPGSDVCRKNAFQVMAVDGVCSGVIQCPTAEDCLDWLQAVANSISNLTKHNVKKINRNFPVNQQVTTWDWTRAEKSFTVYEIMCKVLKDNDLLDKRKHCFRRSRC